MDSICMLLGHGIRCMDMGYALWTLEMSSCGRRICGYGGCGYGRCLLVEEYMDKAKDLKGLNVEILPKMRKRIKNCKSIF